MADDGCQANRVCFCHARCVELWPRPVEDQSQQNAGIEYEPQRESVEIGNEFRKSLGSRPFFLESGQGVGAAKREPAGHQR